MCELLFMSLEVCMFVYVCVMRVYAVCTQIGTHVCIIVYELGCVYVCVFMCHACVYGMHANRNTCLYYCL